jgi:hypothetical protein
MGIFDSLGKQGASRASQGHPQQMTPEQARQQMEAGVKSLHENPASFAKQNRLNVPENMTDANQIIDYLQQSRQVPPGMVQAARMMARRLGNIR